MLNKNYKNHFYVKMSNLFNNTPIKFQKFVTFISYKPLIIRSFFKKYSLLVDDCKKECSFHVKRMQVSYVEIYLKKMVPTFIRDIRRQPKTAKNYLKTLKDSRRFPNIVENHSNISDDFRTLLKSLLRVRKRVFCRENHTTKSE